jgi:hypothetical protein
MPGFDLPILRESGRLRRSYPVPSGHPAPIAQSLRGLPVNSRRSGRRPALIRNAVAKVRLKAKASSQNCEKNFQMAAGSSDQVVCPPLNRHQVLDAAQP